MRYSNNPRNNPLILDFYQKRKQQAASRDTAAKSIMSKSTFHNRILSWTLIVIVTLTVVVGPVQSFPSAKMPRHGIMRTSLPQASAHPVAALVQKQDKHSTTTCGPHRGRTSFPSTQLGAKTKKDVDTEDTSSKPTAFQTFWKTLQDKPGGLLLLPFALLFGIDLILNIVFLTKRSLEFWILGQAPSTETWF